MAQGRLRPVVLTILLCGLSMVAGMLLPPIMRVEPWAVLFLVGVLGALLAVAMNRARWAVSIFLIGGVAAGASFVAFAPSMSVGIAASNMTDDAFDVMLLRLGDRTFDGIRLDEHGAAWIPVWQGETISAFPASDYRLVLTAKREGFAQVLELPKSARIDLIIQGRVDEGYEVTLAGHDSTE